MIAELARLGWARSPESGRIEIAAGHLLNHLALVLGAADAQTYLVDLALKSLLLCFEYKESELEAVDLAEDRLMDAYEGFVLDDARVAAECLAQADDEAVRAELEGLQYELGAGGSP